MKFLWRWQEIPSELLSVCALTPNPSWCWTMNTTQHRFMCSSLVMQALLSIWADGNKAVALRESCLHFTHHSCFLAFFFIPSDFWACCSLLSRKIWSTIEDIHGNTIFYLFFFFFQLYIFILHHSKMLYPNTAYPCKHQALSLLALAKSNSEQCRKCRILQGCLWFQESCPRWALVQLIFKLY